MIIVHHERAPRSGRPRAGGSRRRSMYRRAVHGRRLRPDRFCGSIDSPRHRYRRFPCRNESFTTQTTPSTGPRCGAKTGPGSTSGSGPGRRASSPSHPDGIRSSIPIPGSAGPVTSAQTTSKARFRASRSCWACGRTLHTSRPTSPMRRHRSPLEPRCASSATSSRISATRTPRSSLTRARWCTGTARTGSAAPAANARLRCAAATCAAAPARPAGGSISPGPTRR